MSAAKHNLYSHFKKQFESRPSRELIQTDEGKSRSFSDFDVLSAKIVTVITDLGAAPGDRVSVQVEKSPEAFALYLACLRGGFVFHPLNPAYTPSELEYFFKDAEPTVIVCDSSNAESVSTVSNSGAKLLTLDADGHGTLIEKASQAKETNTVADCDQDDVAALLYSSGTTGVPKGIMLTHKNLLSNTQSLVSAWGFTEKDRLLHALPIFHVHGLFVAIGCVMLSGASMRWLTAFSAETVQEFLPECTVMMGVPTYYTRLLSQASFTSSDCEHARLFVSGSAPLLEETFHEFEQRTGHRILERYGMTETNMNTSNPLIGDRKPGTVGPPLPGVSVRVVDDSGEIVPESEIGNLQVKGDHVFRGYWRQADKTAEDFTDDGFFNTGDKASIDSDGYVSIVGRAKDLVITGGLNVYPKEVESFLDKLDGVSESAVIGVPHADFGEAVVAVVVRSDSDLEEDRLMQQAREHLANFKIPKRVVFVEELPRNTMAKVQKKVLRDAYSSLFD